MNPRIIALQERFMRDSSERRLGAIASDLMRLSSMLRSGADGLTMIQDVTIELKLFTEWAAHELTLAIQEILLELQREICVWNPDRKDYDKKNVARRAGEWAEKILQYSGLAE